MFLYIFAEKIFVMKKLLCFILFISLFIVSCKDDEMPMNGEDENPIGEVFDIPTVEISGLINFDLEGDFNPTNLRIVSGFHEGVVSEVGGKTNSDIRSYEITQNEGNVQLISVLDGEEPLLQYVANPLEIVEEINPSTTAEAMVLLHPLLATTDAQESMVIKEAIRTSPSFDNLVNEVKADLLDGNAYLEGEAPKYLSYKNVLEEVVTELTSNSEPVDLGSGLELVDFQETADSLKFKIKNKSKRWLKAYVDSYQDNVLVETKEYEMIQSEDFELFEILDGINFESISDEYAVAKKEFDEITLKVYGIGFSNVPEIPSEDFDRALEPIVGSLVFDFGLPIIGMITGLGDLKSELRGRPASFFTAFKNIVDGVVDDISDNTSLSANLSLALYDGDQLGFGKQLLGGIFSAMIKPENSRYFGDFAKAILNGKISDNISLRVVASKLLIGIQIVDYAFTAINLGASTLAAVTSDMVTRFVLYKRKVELEFIQVDGGIFNMGCTSNIESSPDHECFPEELPVHSVTVNTFHLSKYEITNCQYVEFLNALTDPGDVSGLINLDSPSSVSNSVGIVQIGSQFEVINGQDNYPVGWVTWFGAFLYCDWANGRLPTEAEWEFAARGGNLSQNFIYSGSNNVHDVAWFLDSTFDGPYLIDEVGSRAPNELGFHDMSGNAREWCSDWYKADYYSESPSFNPQGPEEQEYKVFRAGGGSSLAEFATICSRGWSLPYGSPDFNCGFRCARDW